MHRYTPHACQVRVHCPRAFVQRKYGVKYIHVSSKAHGRRCNSAHCCTLLLAVGSSNVTAKRPLSDHRRISDLATPEPAGQPAPARMLPSLARHTLVCPMPKYKCSTCNFHRCSQKIETSRPDLSTPLVRPSDRVRSTTAA